MIVERKTGLNLTKNLLNFSKGSAKAWKWFMISTERHGRMWNMLKK
jgi:hypothetical protein